MGKEVLLVFPGKKSNIKPQLPLSVLFLAEALEKNGYVPRIIDMRVKKNPFDFQIEDVICVGISAMTSPMILEGTKFAKHIRGISLHTPIVWGGIHASILPDQTILNKYIDIVVRGDGELTLLELVKKLESGEPLESVKGITYKENGKIKVNPDRELIDLNEIGTLPYHLLDLSKYNIDEFTYHSSRGCPHNCSFCYEASKKGYRFKNSENVLKDLEYIIDNFNPRLISFAEDNFFANRKRVEEICRGMIEKNLKIQWYPTCRVDYFSKYDPEFIKLLKESGLKEITFGGESGSTKILKFIHKDIEVEETILAIKKCKEIGIVPMIAFMCGFPGETRDDTQKTLDLIDNIKGIYNKTLVNGLFLFTPFPNTPLTDKLQEAGYKFPSSLEEWGKCLFGHTTLNKQWLEKEYINELITISDIIRFKYINERGYSHLLKSKFHIIPYLIFNSLFDISARIRWKFRYFKYPIEWRLWSWIRTRYLGHA